MRNLPEPVITAVRSEEGSIRIEMSSGIGFEFPAEKLAGLKPENAGVLDTSNVRIDREGHSLVFGVNEIVIPIMTIIVELIGERSLSSELSRRRGSVKTIAKREAVRNNGKLGGRPPKAGADPKRRERIFGAAEKSLRGEK